VFDLISQAFDRPLNVLQMARPPNIEDGLREQDAAEPGAHRPLEDIVTAPVSWSYADPDDKAAIVKALTGQDVLVGAVFTREMGLSADSLKMIALPAAGFEKIASDAVPEGCVVVNAYEHEAPIAEWVMMAAEVLDTKCSRPTDCFDRTIGGCGYSADHPTENCLAERWA